MEDIADNWQNGLSRLQHDDLCGFFCSHTDIACLTDEELCFLSEVSCYCSSQQVVILYVWRRITRQWTADFELWTKHLTVLRWMLSDPWNYVTFFQLLNTQKWMNMDFFLNAARKSHVQWMKLFIYWDCFDDRCGCNRYLGMCGFYCLLFAGFDFIMNITKGQCLQEQPTQSCNLVG